MLLPWRHVMHWRLMKGKTAIPIRYIAPRWQLSSKLNQPASGEDVPDMNIASAAFQIRESAMTARRTQVLNGTTKYKHALERGKSIVDIMSRNGTHVFREMMTALQKFEEVIKVGVAPFVGRKETWIDPLFQLSSLPFTSDNTDTAGADAADVVTGVSPTSKVNCEHLDEPSAEQPPTQRSAIPMEPKVPQVTKPVVLDTSGVPQGTEATNADRVCSQQGKPREGELCEGEPGSSKRQDTSRSSVSSGSFVVSKKRQKQRTP
ncbi:hypothetical protein PC129_g23966 [Phytophthora cactorum]|uniref:Uncharacterized protein n=3 Tax=Phytophthora cactorum TaxID=29920 RepID=A0A329RCC0_9STRA|nr:hypothetical protein PC111_g24177 [Phytophthora cactorum]KAG2791486.1 hypothetical protein PC112_g24225 [Phytophthora cactorum]KAG2871194.1 hypothetical protein PC114_g27030 [Phytophthora cactorum]KAG2918478.1 hypothetical protein PC117_g17075 [Phytophthora cactorum]KAG3046734.1 hypothetical protein PC122_g24263 [Phytophthora cactorum]